jgi:hypothetical protein
MEIISVDVAEGSLIYFTLISFLLLLGSRPPVPFFSYLKKMENVDSSEAFVPI